MLEMVFGPYLGCGKTAYMVYVAKQKKSSHYIVSNFQCSLSDDVAPAEALLLQDYDSDTLMLVDELWSLIDARSWQSNDFYNSMILMSRKKDLDIMGTSQMPSMVDLRFRNISDFRSLCTRRGDGLSAMIKVYRGWYVVKNNDIVLKTEKLRFAISDVAQFYDTREVIERNRRLKIDMMVKIIQSQKQVSGFDLKLLLSDGVSMTKKKNLLRYVLGCSILEADIILDRLS